MVTNLSVLTLNCWAIPYLTKLKNERVSAIGDKLSEGQHDIVVLEEIWSKHDYDKLRTKLAPKLPYSHYFDSGWTGSGICVFSKGAITATFFHPYRLNGYPHIVEHADWYGGCGVGMVKIHYQAFNIHVYCSHLHAQYDFNSSEDEYHAHRTCQAFELSQFIRFTSETCDLVIAAGDFNLMSDALGYKLLCSNANLFDSWLEKQNSSDGLGVTMDVPNNSFTRGKHHHLYPEGQRIDYILYRGNVGVKVQCLETQVCMDCIPDKSYNYSDHFGVETRLLLQRSRKGVGTKVAWSCYGTNSLFFEAVCSLDRGLSSVSRNQKYYATLFAAFFSVVVAAVFWVLSKETCVAVILIGCIVLSFVSGYWFVMFMVMCCSERNALLCIKRDILNIMNKDVANGFANTKKDEINSNYLIRS